MRSLNVASALCVAFNVLRFLDIVFVFVLHTITLLIVKRHELLLAAREMRARRSFYHDRRASPFPSAMLASFSLLPLLFLFFLPLLFLLLLLFLLDRKSVV